MSVLKSGLGKDKPLPSMDSKVYPLDKVIVIGIDGANPRRIRSLMKENKLPNITRLVQE